MRVIAGSARGRRLSTPEGRDVRPTTDKVKESIFNIIQFELPGAVVLDLFAGSGQLGIEALSRGAERAVFLDSSPRSLTYVRENLGTTGFADRAQVRNAEAAAYLSRTAETFDIALLDPPYRKEILPEILPLLAPHMAEDGIILCETAVEENLPERAGTFAISREYRYGSIKLTLYRNHEED